jgi:methionyl-tRNA formyltransferase
MRIIFMGTPDFAVASLAILVENGQQVVAVVTAPDKPSGRGLALNESAVKKYAVANNLPMLQPEKLKSPLFLEQLKSYQADLQIVVAFRMLPEVVWAMPRLGTFNLHASLLPQYRGAAPINWAIINGEKETGVTTFFLQHEIDTGAIIFQEKTAIGAIENVGDLYSRLMAMGGDLVLKTVFAIANNNYPQIAQNNDQALHHAPKIFKETCEIDWEKTADEINNFIRGLAPYPGAFTVLNNKTVKIFKAEVLESFELLHDADPGALIGDKKQFVFKCRRGYLSVIELQQEGKKRMSIGEYLRGLRA